MQIGIVSTYVPQSEVFVMKKKVILLVLLSVLLCVFAASALADIDGVQLWEGGLYYATTPLTYSFDGKPVYLVEVNSDGDMVVDYNDYYSWTETPASNYGITDGWRIPTEDEMAYLFDTVGHVTSFDFDKGAKISCTITGKNNKTLTLYATGTVQTQSTLENENDIASYVTTGQFLYFDRNSSSCDFVDQGDGYGGQVILVKDPPHTHAYQFTASGDTITATCASCPKPNEAELTLTISGKAENDYSGHPVTPVTMTLAGNTSTWKDLTGEDLPKIAYYNGDTLLTEAPTDVGTYTAKISVGSVPASKEFKINPKSVNISVYPTITPNNATYTGEPITFTVTAKEHGEDLVPGKDFEIMGWTSHPENYTATTLKVTDVTDGAYITFKGIGNYKDSVMLPYAVVPKPIRDPSITVTITPEKVTYTGETFTFTVTAKDGSKDLVPGTDFEIRNWKNIPNATANTVQGTDASNYSTALTIIGLGNYNVEGVNVSAIYQIVRKPITITPDNQTIVKGDPLPKFTWSCGDTAADAELESLISYSTDVKELLPGKYDIKPQKVYLGSNYYISYANGTLTVLDIFTVTFDANGGSDIPSQDIVEGKTATEPSDPTKSGMTFSGWFTDADCTKAYDFSTPVTAATTLYAGWLNDPVKVTFESNGGSAVTPQTVEYNKAATKPADPTKSGMTFTGWFTDADCTKAYDFSTPVTADITLYAGWETAEPSPSPSGDPSPSPTPSGDPSPSPSPAPSPSPDPDDDPEIIEGQNGEWTKDSKDSLKFRSDADFETFVRVEVDDKTLDSQYYTKASGSTIIILKPAFLQTLAEGKHKLAIVSKMKSGEKKAITTFFIKPAPVPPMPPTGDSTPVALLLLLCLASIGTAVLVLKKKTGSKAKS